MEKRMFPLFIIDSSRQHGRGEECDYLYCTAHDCEFLAKVELIEEKEFKSSYNKNDKRIIYSDMRNGLRIRISVIQVGEVVDEPRIQTLLKKALKEVLERRQTNVVGDNITDSDVILLITTIMEQLKEQIALHPNSPANYILQLRIFSKILQDYKK